MGIFVWLVLRHGQNIPYWDDYEAGLQALTGLLQNGDWFAFFFRPNNEHIIATTRLVFLADYWATGQIDFRLVQWLGNLYLLGLLGLLAFHQTRRPTPAQWGWLPLAALLLFTPRLYDSSLWAMAATSNYGVLFFSFLAFLLLERGGRAARTGAPLAGVTAFLCQANGLFCLGLTTLWLASQRRWRDMAIHAAAAGLCALAYIAIHHHFGTRTAETQSIALALRQPWQLLEFLLLFLGSLLPSAKPALAFGALLLAAAALALFRGIHRDSPFVTLCLAMILASALATGLNRMVMGVDSALSSRYAINSALMAGLLLYHFLHRAPLKNWQFLSLLLAGCALYAAIAERSVPEIANRHLANAALHADQVACRKRFNHYSQPIAADILDSANRLRLYDWATPAALDGACPDRQVEWFVNPAPVAIARGYGGSLDRLRIDADRVVIEGWLDLPDSAQAPRLYLALPSAPREAATRRQQRGDVAAQLGEDRLSSGFTLTLRFADAAQATAAAGSLCIGFGAASGPVRLLRGPTDCSAYLLPQASPRTLEGALPPDNI